MGRSAKSIMKSCLIALSIAIVGGVLTYWITGRWDMTVIVSVFLLAGSLNASFGNYLARRSKFEKRDGGR